METTKKERLTKLMTESLQEFKTCPVGYQLYLRITFYNNGAILSEIRYHNELISIISKEDVAGAYAMDYFEYNRDYGMPDLYEMNKIQEGYFPSAKDQW
jgi:hypothetical protein